MLSPEQADSVCQEQHLGCMDGRKRPKGQIDQCLLDGPNPKKEGLADDMLAHLSGEYPSTRLTCSSTRHTECSIGQRNSLRVTAQRDSHIERASYKRMPRMGDGRTDRTTIRATVGVSEHVNMSKHEVDGTPEVMLVAGVASMLKLRKVAEQQKSEGLRMY